MIDKLNSDLKAALLAGDKVKAETLRGVKSALLNEAIAQGVKDQGLNEEQTMKVLQKEAKKRAEAAEMYQKGGAADRAAAEQAEKGIIDSYLPTQASEEDVNQAVADELTKLDSPTMADMGKIIGVVKAKLGPTADGALIAQAVKKQLES